MIPEAATFPWRIQVECNLWPIRAEIRVVLGVQNILLIVLAISLVATVEAVVARTRLRYRIALARQVPPIDDATGLLTRGSYETRALTEIGRSRRFKTTTNIELVVIVSGDSDVLGRALCAALEFPEVGVRISHDAFCIISPGLQVGNPQRCVAIAAEHDVVVASGSASFPIDGDDVVELLRIATDRIDVST